MKRGAIVLTQESLKEILKSKVPEDFKLSGAEFDPAYNVLKLHGYSESFHEVAENAMHLNEIKKDVCRANLIHLSENITLVTDYDDLTRRLVVSIYDKSIKICTSAIVLKFGVTLPDLIGEK